MKKLNSLKGELDFFYNTVENSNTEESKKLDIIDNIAVSKMKVMELLQESDTVKQFRNRLGSQSEIKFSSVDIEGGGEANGGASSKAGGG